MERIERSRQDLDEKMTFESRLARELSGIFKRMADEYRRSMIDDGVPPDFSSWQSFFDEMLSSHYKAVSATFSKRIEAQEGVTHTEDENELIAAILAAYFVGQSSEASKKITATNIRQAQESIERARMQEQADFDETGQRYDAQTMANVSSNVFKSLAFGRIATIAQTETQKSAEAAKKVEADVMISGGSDINKPVPDFKPEKPRAMRMWSAILDDDTRDDHVAADGQRREIDENFIVGGHPMRFPGDTRAPIEQWINCRCNAIYYLPDEVMQRRAA